MQKNKLFAVLGLVIIVSMALASCQPAAVAPAAEKPAESKPAEAAQPAAEEKQEVGTISLWTQYNTDTPASARDKMFSDTLKNSHSQSSEITRILSRRPR